MSSKWVLWNEEPAMNCNLRHQKKKQSRKAAGDGAAEQAVRQAIQLHRTGRLGEAMDLCRQALSNHPGHSMALNIGAMAAFQMGEVAQATDWFTELSRLNPSDPEARYNLGVVLQAAEKPEQAEEAYRGALAVNPTHGGALNNLGVILLILERPEEAVDAINRLIEVAPDNADAHSNLSTALISLGRFDESLEASRLATELAPDNLKANINLGSALLAKDRPHEALPVCRRGIQLAPRSPEAHHNLGQALQDGGKPAEAMTSYRKALSLNPLMSEAQLNIGSLLVHDGLFDEAEAAFRKSLEINPLCSKAYLAMCRYTPKAIGNGEIDAIQSLATDPALSDQDKIPVHFSLANALEMGKEYDRSFDQLERGNRMVRSTYDYDVAEDEAKLKRIAEVFSPSLLAERESAGSRAEAPIFILGMPRSGTTLVEQILASHSQIHGAGELNTLNHLAAGMAGDFPEFVLGLDGDSLRKFGEDYIETVGAMTAPRFTDKMPRNFLYIGLIHLALPGAKIIHCRRDPMDTCFSCYQQLFRGAQPFAYDLAELGRYYRAYKGLMAHWRKVLPGRIMDIAYEDLVNDQEEQSRRLLEFCGLDWENGCLNFYETKRTVKTASASQVRMHIYKSSVKRWKHYESHLEPLIEALGKD